MIDFDKYDRATEKTFYKKLGKVVNVVGLTIESVGPDAKLSDLCQITTEDGRTIMAEVTGFKDNKTLLMPYENTE